MPNKVLSRYTQEVVRKLLIRNIRKDFFAMPPAAGRKMCSVGLLALLLLPCGFGQATVSGAVPTMNSISVSGTNVLITATGTPGDLQFLTRNYFQPETNFTYYLPFATTNLSITNFNHVVRHSLSNADNVVSISA